MALTESKYTEFSGRSQLSFRISFLAFSLKKNTFTMFAIVFYESAVVITNYFNYLRIVW